MQATRLVILTPTVESRNLGEKLPGECDLITKNHNGAVKSVRCTYNLVCEYMGSVPNTGTTLSRAARCLLSVMCCLYDRL